MRGNPWQRRRGEILRNALLVAVRAYDQRGVKPNLAQLAAIVGGSPASVSAHLARMRAEGMLPAESKPRRGNPNWRASAQ